MMQAQESKAKINTPGSQKTCISCGHLRVCSIHRTFSPYLEQQFTEKTKPFEAWDLAVICKAYFNASILAVLGTGE